MLDYSFDQPKADTILFSACVVLRESGYNGPLVIDAADNDVYMNAAYHHDLAYAKYIDKVKRLEGDRRMIRELEDIDSPAVREQMERAVVRPYIGI